MDKLKTQLKEANELLDFINANAEKFQNGNKAAGTRARVGSMDLIKKLKEVRVTISEIKNS